MNHNINSTETPTKYTQLALRINGYSIIGLVLWHQLFQMHSFTAIEKSEHLPTAYC